MEVSKKVRMLWEQRVEGSNPFAPTNKPVATSTLATPGSPVARVTGLFTLGRMSWDVLVSPMFHRPVHKNGDEMLAVGLCNKTAFTERHGTDSCSLNAWPEMAIGQVFQAFLAIKRGADYNSSNSAVRLTSTPSEKNDSASMGLLQGCGAFSRNLLHRFRFGRL